MVDQEPMVRLTTHADDEAVPDGVAVMRLDRPPVNALNRALQDRIIETCAALDQDRSVRVVVLYGGERALAAGADIKEFAAKTQADMLVSGDAISRTATAVAAIGKPVIAAAEGHVLGGGFELAIAADLRVSSATASWGLPEVLLGLMPAAGATQRLPRIVGAAVAKRLMFTGRAISGEEAGRLGLVDEVCPPGEALAAALRLAADLAGRPPLALRAMKAAIDRSFDLPLEAGLDYEQHACHAIFATRDRERGVEAFVAKSPGGAVFHGD